MSICSGCDLPFSDAEINPSCQEVYAVLVNVGHGVMVMPVAPARVRRVTQSDLTICVWIRRQYFGISAREKGMMQCWTEWEDEYQNYLLLLLLGVYDGYYANEASVV